MNHMISIIIPAYNIAPYVGATLDSVLAQTYSDIEVIVVNDGSKDRTAEILDSYAAKDARIKVIHKENGGVTSARIRGIEEAAGEWIGFVDGDDYVEPDMYDRLLKNALRFGADISHCGYRMVFPNGRVDYYYNSGRLVEQNMAEGLRDLLSGTFVEPGLCNKLFHRHLFCDMQKNKWVPEDIRINEDLLMNYWLFKASERSVYEDFCPYHYVLRKGSAATSKVNAYKLWDPLRVAQRILEDAPDEVEPAANNKMIRLLTRSATMDLKENPELIRPYRTHCRKELRRRLPGVLSGNACGLKLKILALWAVVWPASYTWVHKKYAKMTGLDKKYDLE